MPVILDRPPVGNSAPLHPLEIEVVQCPVDVFMVSVGYKPIEYLVFQFFGHGTIEISVENGFGTGLIPSCITAFFPHKIILTPPRG